MRGSASKNLFVTFQKIAIITIVLSTLSVRAAFSAKGGIPGRPTPPRDSTYFFDPRKNHYDQLLR